MKKFLYVTVVVIMAVVFLAEVPAASAKDITKITVNGTKVFRAPLSWKKFPGNAVTKISGSLRSRGKRQPSRA